MSFLRVFSRFSLPALAFAMASSLSAFSAPKAHAEAKLLIEASTGKVLFSEKATYPWYPASVTKLMTAYTTFRAVKEGHTTLDTLLMVSQNAAIQQPTKMGFPVGTRVTIENALKMLLVKSANDMAVVIAEGVGGSVEGFAEMMNANAQRLSMTQSHFINPNGLPAENHVTSARDLGILARALITEFPEYDSYWHIHSIRYGKRVIHNYNSLLDRYPGADGMKTGFICASGYNLVASATRNGKRLIAVILGSYSGAKRAQEAAELLERGFNGAPSWLTASLGTVEALKPIDASPPDLHEEMCGRHRHKPPSEDNDEDDANAVGSDAENGQPLVTANLKPLTDKFVLGPPNDNTPPIVVFTGPAGHPDRVIETAAAKKRKKGKAKRTAKTESEQKDKPAQAKPAHSAKKQVKQEKPKVSSANP